MATIRGNARLQVGSAPWIAEERTSSLQIAAAETEEFTFSARNEVDWLNEHMAEIFSKNQVHVAEIFKTPGKLRGKTPRTVRKNNLLETREPLSDVFTSTIKGEPSPFTQLHFDRPATTFQVAEDEPEVPVAVVTTSNAAKESPPKPSCNAFDSGYHGSQPDDVTQVNEPYVLNMAAISSPARPRIEDSTMDEEHSEDNVEILGRDSEARRTTEGSFQSAKEEQTRNQQADIAASQEGKEEHDEEMAGTEVEIPIYPVLTSPLQGWRPVESSPQKRSPQRNTPARPSPLKEMILDEVSETPEPVLPQSPVYDTEPVIEELPAEEDEVMDDAQSQSDGSSPMRPIVRKSSLNFASLPAREPITTKKSIGNRVSRTSHVDQSRPSYYGRLTGGKSIGNAKQDEDEDDEMEADQVEETTILEEDTESKMTRLHNKTSTQRLQDQISMLGQSQTDKRPSKSLVNSSIPAANETSTGATAIQEVTQLKSPICKQSSQHRVRPPPGAFPEDEDDSWIGPPPENAGPPSIFSPRAQMTKSHTTDILEEMQGKANPSSFQYDVPKRCESVRSPSPRKEPSVPASPYGHKKSVSTSVIRSPNKAGDSSEGKKGISVSNPAPSVTTLNEKESSTTPPKSPGRGHRGSPLKAAKDKFSSILKSSRGLFASSAAASTEAKTSAMSPTSSKTDLRVPSFEDVLSRANDSNSMYPNLEAHTKGSQLSLRMPTSPFKSGTRKTRASIEREEKKRMEEARELREAKEVKEALKLDSQLEKARSKVRDDVRKDFVAQERAATVQKEALTIKDLETQAKPSQIESPRATRSSPRKTKAQLEAEGIAAAAASTDEIMSRDTEMAEASHTMPPPAIPRPKSQIGRPGVKRPLKPAKGHVTKAKPPTVIRVDTGSQRGHTYHPSTSTLAATLQESLSSSQSSATSQTLKHKSSTSSIQSKASTSSFKSAATKALEAAAKKKEQDELAAQKKREIKQENDRQRAAIKEEEKRKEEQQRRQEAEKQRELQRERDRLTAQADAKKTAQRQAIEKRRLEMERAKETRAPPPAIRPPPVDHVALEKALPPLPSQRDANSSRPIRMNAAVQRTQDEPARPGSVMRHNAAKVPPKRPLQQDSEERTMRPAVQRNGPSYQTEHQSKRRRTSDNFDDDDDDATENQPKMTAPPIRQSSSRQKEFPAKSLFPSGYANAPPAASLQRSTLILQHNMNQPSGIHSIDMAQLAKGPIPFASNSNQAGSQHKTPARPGAPSGGGKSAKSAARSSPRYQNGENIVLPEIHTDSEDEDSDAPGDFPVQGWTNSPDLRKALVMQETIDPAQIFGQPGPLNMEEVFSKSKDRWHKFRNRTSSANWSGTDRLTEDDVRKDLEARDKVRRQGGWTYDSMV